MSGPAYSAAFEDSRLKIDRARRHVKELSAEIAAYAARDPVVSVIGLGRNDLERFSVTDAREPVPRELSAIIGDTVHNLRAALDIMACECVRRAGHSDKNVYFPFAKSALDLDFQIDKKNMKRAGKPVVDLIKSLKPYAGGNVALRALHDLDVQDKHRAIIPVVMTVPSMIPVFDDGKRVEGDTGVRTSVPATHALRFANAENASTWRPIGHTESVAFNLMFPSETVFGGREVVPTLHGLVEDTSRIVESFSALFV